MELVGVDVGGSTIKLALVEAFDGVISSKVYRDRTPSPPSLRNIVDAVGALSAPLLRNGGERRIGVALPAIIADGRRTVGIGLASDWDGTDARRLLEDRLGREAVVINDADAAGLAEMQKGETAGGEGTVIVLTLGTFIGSALCQDRAGPVMAQVGGRIQRLPRAPAGMVLTFAGRAGRRHDARCGAVRPSLEMPLFVAHFALWRFRRHCRCRRFRQRRSAGRP